MKYTPTSDRMDELVDVDALIDGNPLPKEAKKVRRIDRIKKIRKTKKSPRPSPLDPRTNRAIPNLLTWGAMLLVAWIIMPYIAGLIESVSDPVYFVALLTAGGFGLGATLLFRRTRYGHEAAYSNTHMFFFLSLGLALGGWIPASLVFVFLGPILAGFGLGTFFLW